MNFVDAVKTCLGKYVDFDGRASRSEYWWFNLFAFIVTFIVAFFTQGGASYSAATAIVYLLFFLPLLSVSIRRLHDRDKSGWFILLGFIPLIGAIVLLIWFVMPGTPGKNTYG